MGFVPFYPFKVAIAILGGFRWDENPNPPGRSFCNLSGCHFAIFPIGDFVSGEQRVPLLLNSFSEPSSLWIVFGSGDGGFNLFFPLVSLLGCVAQKVGWVGIEVHCVRMEHNEIELLS